MNSRTFSPNPRTRGKSHHHHHQVFTCVSTRDGNDDDDDNNDDDITRHSPPVLVPSLDLGVGQREFGGQFHAILHAEVFLTLKRLLQTRQLMVREGCASLAGFLRLHQQTAATGFCVRQAVPSILCSRH